MFEYFKTLVFWRFGVVVCQDFNVVLGMCSCSAALLSLCFNTQTYHRYGTSMCCHTNTWMLNNRIIEQTSALWHEKYNSSSTRRDNIKTFM